MKAKKVGVKSKRPATKAADEAVAVQELEVVVAEFSSEAPEVEASGLATVAAGLPEPPAGFVEFEYLTANPDVKSAIEAGVFPTGWHHYYFYGRSEGRQTRPSREASRARPTSEPEPAAVPPAQDVTVLRYSFENLIVSPAGGMFLVGWIDDVNSKLIRILVEMGDGSSITVNATHISRTRRGDVEAALGAARPHPYGFWAFLDTGFNLQPQSVRITLFQANGASQTLSGKTNPAEDIQLRDIVLSHLAAADHFGNRHLEAIVSMGHWLGAEMIKFNRAISRKICSAPYVETFGNRTRKLKGSIIVCLYGKPEYFFLQNALFTGLPGIQDYEFIYVCNSPELAERLLVEARIAAAVYDVTQTLVLLPGNAGFGAANNVAARYARSKRMLIVNPDVFPRDADWAAKHTQVLASRPSRETELFGVPLYYEDGSLMHGGMYFDVDSQPSVTATSFTRHDFVRVEHYGKGAPAETRSFRKRRMVPAVTGAFISIDRKLYDRIEGFTEDFIFGHYEDADLCLKALMTGTNTWMHDIGLWHLEGKGSTRLPVHEGGSVVNRWLFSTNWGELIKGRLRGPNVDLEHFHQKSRSTGGSVDESGVEPIAGFNDGNEAAA